MNPQSSRIRVRVLWNHKANRRARHGLITMEHRAHLATSERYHPNRHAATKFPVVYRAHLDYYQYLLRERIAA